MARDPKADPYYNPEFSPEVNEVTNDFVYKKTGKQTTGDAIIVRPRGGSFDVLLIERKRGPHQGGLALPGGFKEGADSVEDFVAREALEETGLTNKDIKETIDLPTKTDRFDWDVRFADGVDVSGKIFMVDDSFIPKAGDDAVSAKFVPVEDIASGKVDIAFLHSEWIYDTSQKLDSNYSGTSELQEIVAKDRKRNIDFMQEINTKRAIDNKPLMPIDKSTPVRDAAKEKFVQNYIANNQDIDPKLANERALTEFDTRYSFEIDQAQGTFNAGKIEAGTMNYAPTEGFYGGEQRHSAKVPTPPEYKNELDLYNAIEAKNNIPKGSISKVGLALDPIAEGLEFALKGVGLGSIAQWWVKAEAANFLAGLIRGGGAASGIAQLGQSQALMGEEFTADADAIKNAFAQNLGNQMKLSPSLWLENKYAESNLGKGETPTEQGYNWEKMH